jgi:hypothetical protein
MLLAVAGMDKEGIDKHTHALSDTDWPQFSPAERAAFGVARTLAHRKAPTAHEMQRLIAHLGRERTIDLIWWVCHCHYMTCVSNALQLPLESGNVFDGFVPTSRSTE